MEFITVNSHTTGKFSKKTINGRSHIVTKMRPIRGDIAMNRIYYPNAEVKKSFTQFQNMIAPANHPRVNGHNISAYHPLAINANNIGGFIQNPTMKGKDVIVDFVLDIETANNSEDGKETVRRIEEGEKIGVSTGLTIDQLTVKNGKDEFGKDFSHEGVGFTFDHVAILLNEEAAGDHAGTEMLTNSDMEEDITVINLDKMMVTNELTVHELRNQLESMISTGLSDTFVWVEEIFIDSRRFIFSMEDSTGRKFFQQSYAVDDSDTVSLVDDRKEVIKKIEFEEVTNTNQKVDDMDLEKLVLALIANGLTGKDKGQLMAMSESELGTFLVNTTTADEAKEILSNAGFDFKAFESFTENKESFDAWMKSEDEKLVNIRKDIVENSDYTDDMLEGKGEPELLALKSLTENKAKPTKRIGGAVMNSGDSSEDKVAASWD